MKIGVISLAMAPYARYLVDISASGSLDLMFEQQAKKASQARLRPSDNDMVHTCSWSQAHVHVVTPAQLRDAIIIVGDAVVKRERTNVTKTSLTHDSFAHLEDDGPVSDKIHARANTHGWRTRITRPQIDLADTRRTSDQIIERVMGIGTVIVIRTSTSLSITKT